MEILHIRKWFTEKSTVGEYFIGGTRLCYVIEDKDRGLINSMPLDEINKLKVHSLTCIPYTDKPYEIIISRSNRFSKQASDKAGKPVDIFLPEVLNVPGFAGVRIHSGNKPEDSEGCQLPGFNYQPQINPNYLGDSRSAFAMIQAKIEQALKTEKVYLRIIKEQK